MMSAHIRSAGEILRAHGIQYSETRMGKYTTNCPHCNGGYLNVEIKRDGVVWFCHRCDEGGGDTFVPRCMANGKNDELGPIKAVYPYQDESDEQLFEVLRFEPING